MNSTLIVNRMVLQVVLTSCAELARWVPLFCPLLLQRRANSCCRNILKIVRFLAMFCQNNILLEARYAVISCCQSWTNCQVVRRAAPGLALATTMCAPKKLLPVFPSTEIAEIGQQLISKNRKQFARYTAVVVILWVSTGNSWRFAVSPCRFLVGR